MQRLEVSGAVRPIYGSLGVKRLTNKKLFFVGLLSICNCFFVRCKIVYRFVATNCFFMRRARIDAQLSPEGVYFY